MKRIKAAIIGAGWVTQHCYLPLLGLNSPLEVVKIYDIDPARAERAILPLDSGRVALDFEECLDDSISAVLICTPTPTHLSLLTRCLEERKYVLCEKPVLRDQEEVDRLETLPLAAQRVMGSATTRLRRDVSLLLSWVQEGRIGALRNLKLSWRRGSGVPTAAYWRTDPLMSPTGVLEDLGPHLLDIGAALLPLRVATRPETVASALECRYGDAWRVAEWFGESAAVRRDSYEVPDRAVATFDFPGGVSMELDVCWVSDDEGDASSIVVEGTDGIVEVQGLFGFSTSRRNPQQICWLKRGRHLIERVEFIAGPQEQLDAFGKSIEIFAQFCSGEATPVAAFDEILTVAHWIETIRQGALISAGSAIHEHESQVARTGE